MYCDSKVNMLKEYHCYGDDQTVIILKEEESYKKRVYGANYKLDPENKILTISHPSTKKYISFNILFHFFVCLCMILIISIFILFFHILISPLTNYLFFGTYHIYLLFFEGTPKKFLVVSIAAILGFLTLISELNSVLEYFDVSRCINCGKFFVCKEFKKPEEREISTEDSYLFYFTSYWKCDVCHHEKEINKPLGTHGFTFFKERKGNIKYNCNECGAIDSLFEWKNPDVKQKQNDYIKTIRYYKCTNCNCFIVYISEVDFVETYNTRLAYKSRSF